MNENQPEKMPPVPPFVRFVASAVPMVFDDSLSYYEALCALWKYVQGMTDVINNNATLEEEYIEKFNELKTFVDTYFDNLDVQEEINNKLDDMVEQGTLQEIITSYIQANVAWTFDTVADMKLSENLITGSYAQTLGFHSLNDGGGALYYITDTGSANEMNVIAIGSLYANMVIDEEINVKQVGAYGDGTHDDTSAIQQAMDLCSNVFIPDGTYMINADDHLNPNDGNTVRLSNNATLKAITNDLERYVIFYIHNVDKVEISGGTIQGDRATHTGLTGEWGACIKVDGTSTDIYIHDITLKDAWGDGLTVTTTGDVVTERVHVNNVRRNGYSITCVNSFISNNDFIENTNGTDPQFGVDIEPDVDADILNNVVFNNLRTKNNTGGGIEQHFVRNNTYPYYVEVNDFVSEGDLRGIWFNSTGSDGKVIYNNPLIKNSSSYGIRVKNTDADTSLVINKPVVNGYFIGSSSAASGIYITADSNTTSGNVILNEPFVINCGSSSSNKNSIRFDEITGCTYKDAIVNNPIKLDLGIRFNSLSDNVQIHDGYGIAHIDTDTAPLSLGANPLYSYMTTSNYTQLRQTWISKTAKFPIGYKMRFLNNGSYGVKLYFENQYIYGITSELGKIVQSADAGAYLEIMRIGDGAWTVTAISGTWTHN